MAYSNNNNRNNNNNYDSLRVPLYPYETSNGVKGLRGYQVKGNVKYTVKCFDPKPDKIGAVKYEQVVYITKEQANVNQRKILSM